MKTLTQMFVEDYLAGKRTLVEVQELLIDVIWGERQVAPEELDLAQELDLSIAEYTGDHIDEGELRDQLQSAVGISASAIVDLVTSPKVEFRSSAATMRRSAAFG